MKRLTLQVAAVVLLLAVASIVAFAGGYQLNEHGARATGLGGAFVARAADASAIFFNPAGLAFQKGMHVMLGGTFVLPATTVTSKSATPSETKMESQIFFPPNVYGTYEISDGLVAGLGVFTPYGLGSKYAGNWPGRYSSVETDLKTFFINPTISYKVADNFSIGVGVSYILGSVSLSRKVATYGTVTPVALPGGTAYQPNPATASVVTGQDGNIALEGTASGFGFNAGFIYKPIEHLSIGASFRSETKMEFEGDAVFSNMQGLAQFFPGGTGKATLPMPMNIQAGIAYEVTSDLTIEADMQYVGWDAYDKLTLDLPVGPTVTLIVGPPVPPSPLPQTVTRPLQGPSTDEKKWDVGYIFRVGAEYAYDQNLTLRAGVIQDYTPQPASKLEPMLPDANRIDIALGAGYKVNENITVDLAYLLVLFEERNSSLAAFPASYNSTAHLFGFNVSYAF